MNFQRLLIFTIFCLGFASCKQKESGISNSNPSSNDTISYKSGDTIKLGSLDENTRGSLAELSTYVGKKPSEVDLFSKAGIKDRIKKIMKDEYAQFESSWQADTPLQADAEILYTSACKSGDCKGSEYIIIFDTQINAINLYQFNSNNMRSYEEDNLILGLPRKVQDWMDGIVESHLSLN